MTPIPLVVHGAAGRMGRRVIALATARPDEFRVVAGFDRAGGAPTSIDGVPIASLAEGVGVAPNPGGAAAGTAVNDGSRAVIIDFSTPEALVDLCRAGGWLATLPLVSGTTGLDAAALAALSERAARTPVVWAPNMSVGVQVLARLVAAAAAALPRADIEISETHHHHKKDAPSGTALRLAEAARSAGRTGDIPMHSLRMGEVVGDHEVYFALEHEIVTLRHRALSRDVFAAGALTAARFAASAAPGRYGIDDVLGELPTPHGGPASGAATSAESGAPGHAGGRPPR